MDEFNNTSFDDNIDKNALNNRFAELPEVLYVCYNITKTNDKYTVLCYCICDSENILSNDFIKILDIMHDFKKSFENKHIIFDFTIASIDNIKELVITEESETIYSRSESITRKVDNIKRKQRKKNKK